MEPERRLAAHDAFQRTRGEKGGAGDVEGVGLLLTVTWLIHVCLFWFCFFFRCVFLRFFLFLLAFAPSLCSFPCRFMYVFFRVLLFISVFLQGHDPYRASLASLMLLIHCYCSSIATTPSPFSHYPSPALPKQMTPNHDLRRRASMSALPQPITPGTGAVGGGGAADEGVGSNSLHAGGGPPVTPPSAFRGLSPPNSAASASGVNVRYGAVLDGGVLEGLGGSGGGGYDARVGSGGGQPFGQSPPPDGAGGGRAGSLNGLGIANGGSFVGGFEVGERVHLEKLFQQVCIMAVVVVVVVG